MKSVVICCHVVNILALGLVMRVSAVLVTLRSNHDAIVGVCRPKCCAAPGMRKSIVRDYVMIHLNLLSVGLAALAVESFATDLLIAVSISARRAAIRKMHNPRIVPGRPMWFLIARVERRH